MLAEEQPAKAVSAASSRNIRPVRKPGLLCIVAAMSSSSVASATLDRNLRDPAYLREWGISAKLGVQGSPVRAAGNLISPWGNPQCHLHDLV